MTLERQKAVRLIENLIQIQYEVGDIAKADLISTNVQISNIRKEFNTALGEYENSLANLNNFIGLPIEIDAEIYFNAVKNGKTERQALEESAIAPFTTEIKRSEKNIKPVKKSGVEFSADESFTAKEN